MRNIRFSSWTLVLALLLGTFVATSALAAETFRIRLLRQQGKEVLVYHDHVDGAASGDVAIQVGPTACTPATGQSMRPGRGGDGMTTLIVLDRGGTATTGMGQHSAAIRNALKAFLEGVMGKIESDRVTIIDSSGRDHEPSLLKPTSRIEDVRSFLDGLPAPTGSGADVFGVGSLGMAELDRAGTPLGAVIVISDGVDPAMEKDSGAADNHKGFVETARKRGYPVAAILVSRFSDKRGDGDVKLRNGRSRMTQAAEETNGDLRSVDGDTNLESSLRKQLDEIGAQFAKVERTVCTLCGEVDEKAGAVVDMKMRKGSEVVGQSKASPSPRLDLAGGKYDACGGKADEKTKPECTKDADCNASSKCENSKCAQRKGPKDFIPWIAGGLVLLGLLFGLWAWRRSVRRKREAAEAEERKRTAEAKEQADRLEQARRVVEAERIASLEDAVRKAQQPAQPQVDVQAEIERRMNPEVLRLLNAPGSVLQVDRLLRAGAYLVGAGEDVDIRFESPTISSHHAQLEVDRDGRARLMDLGSSNGTFVNQVHIQPRQSVELRVGDVIGLSRSVLMQLHPVQSAPAGGNPQPRPQRGRTMLEE